MQRWRAATAMAAVGEGGGIVERAGAFARGARLRRSRKALLALAVAASAACARREAARDPAESLVRENSMNDDIAADLDVARAARVFFNHQSVGFNLLAGVQSVGAAAGREVKVVALDGGGGDGHAGGGPGWFHATGGHNGDPKSKIDFFVATLKRVDFKPELAFMKFCYVDFNPQTDVAAVFDYYQKALTTLKRERPDVRFAHVTVPLMEKTNDVKSRLQRLLGRDVWGDDANIRRAEFNERLARAFVSDPIFDLARSESTRSDGMRESFEKNGKVYYSLQTSYTNDGGHLNDAGQRALGAEMVRFVARAMKPGPGASLR
jgi:hypothetical protein